MTDTSYWKMLKNVEKKEKVRKGMGVKQSIVGEVIVKQMKWYGQVERMTPERFLKQILDWIPEGRKKVG